VSISQVGDFTLISMQQANPTFGEVIKHRAIVADILSLEESDLMDDYPIEIVSTGVPYAFVPVKTLSAMHRIRMKADQWITFAQPYESLYGVFAFTMETELPGSTVHSRMFAPMLGIIEDPATGSASGPLGSYLVKHGLVQTQNNVAAIVSEQGIEMGRPSIIQIRIETENDRIVDVDVGGTAVYMGAGVLQI